jgi:hypothetical protein
MAFAKVEPPNAANVRLRRPRSPPIHVSVAPQGRIMLSARDDRYLPDPQFFHRRPHRPRQVDPERPPDPVHRRPDRARDEGTGARQYGDRARTRHHHQGPDGPPELQGARRQDLYPEPDGHAGPRRLRLRSVALAGRLRRLDPGRRRLARRRRPMSTRPSTTITRSSRSSTRSTCPPPNPTAFAPRSRTSSASMHPMPSWLRPSRAWVSRTCWKPS